MTNNTLHDQTAPELGYGTVRLAARHWDHLLPLALGDVAVTGATLTVDRRDVTPNIWAEEALDAAETSLSHYVHQRASGDTSVTALPVFLMQGFRQRCIITRVGSPLTSAADLTGKTVGLTGWPDSGNTWTRVLLEREGVDLDSIQWRVGPLTGAHPVIDRIGARGAGPNVRHTDADGTLVDQLLDGTLDAVFTPFMPPGFHDSDSGLRTLYPNNREAERAYYRAVGYIPGIHVLAVRTAALQRHPGLAQALLDAVEASKQLAAARHGKLNDVVPWLDAELVESVNEFGGDPYPYGSLAVRGQIEDFLAAQVSQGLLTEAPEFTDIFPLELEPTQGSTR